MKKRSCLCFQKIWWVGFFRIRIFVCLLMVINFCFLFSCFPLVALVFGAGCAPMLVFLPVCRLVFAFFPSCFLCFVLAVLFLTLDFERLFG